MDDRQRIEPNEPLEALLYRVSRGEQVTISKNGEPVATLVPTDRMWDSWDVEKAMKNVADLRAGLSLGGLRFKDLIHEGHKY